MFFHTSISESGCQEWLQTGFLRKDPVFLQQRSFLSFACEMSPSVSRRICAVRPFGDIPGGGGLWLRVCPGLCIYILGMLPVGSCFPSLVRRMSSAFGTS
ncbi:hypothetical protein ABH19_02770 [Leptospirillum sp. Group II 'CF-1']|nr:hypothetical protein ABH19_02770 [Leptospirillum sp. Group II 'CF-1']